MTAHQTCERPSALPAALIATGTQRMSLTVASFVTPSQGRIATTVNRAGSWIQGAPRSDQFTAKDELTAYTAAKPAAGGAPPRGRPV